MADADPNPTRRWTRRPLFSANQMLTAQQLNTLMDEQRAHSERLMRGLHGHGVVFGLAVAIRPLGGGFANQAPRPSGDLDISCGMALDRHGRLLHWAGGRLCFEEIVNRTNCPGRYRLSAHYARLETPSGGCGPCGDRPEWIEEGVVFTLTEDCQPADRTCPGHCECVGLDDYICYRTASAPGSIPPAPDLEWACEAAGPLCRVHCSDISYDPAAGIPLACVEVRNLAPPDCPERWGFVEAGETCEIRPRVYRTPLLYELIRGCQHDLARVQSLSWEKWLGKDPDWKDLAGRLRANGGMAIRFTKPIAAATVHAGSVFLTAAYRDQETDYVLARRIPARLNPAGPEDGFADCFEFDFHPDWIQNAVKQKSPLRQGGRIELTIRGQMLRDRCGNMLDSVPLFYEPQTPAERRPGADFVAVFRFARAPEPPTPPRERPGRTPPTTREYADY